jgi:hypothetical protein
LTSVPKELEELRGQIDTQVEKQNQREFNRRARRQRLLTVKKPTIRISPLRRPSFVFSPMPQIKDGGRTRKRFKRYT